MSYCCRCCRCCRCCWAAATWQRSLDRDTCHRANPNLPDYFTALYFGLTTLTTVRFGDITPVTFEGRLVVSVSILAGIAIIPVQLSSLAEALLRRDATVSPAAPDGRAVCNACGASGHTANAAFCYACGSSLDA